MNDILFGNNNTKTIKRLSKQYFKKNKVRNLAAILAIVLTAFLFTSITSADHKSSRASHGYLSQPHSFVSRIASSDFLFQ